MKALLTFTDSDDPYSFSPLEREPRTGPILSLLAERRFDTVYLFSTPRPAELAEDTHREIEARYPKTSTVRITFPLKDPTNYIEILSLIRRQFRRIRRDHPDQDYAIAASSSSPQIHACWLMLASSGEIPATILQTMPPEFRPPGKDCVREIALTTGSFPEVSFLGSVCHEAPRGAAISAVRRELGLVGNDPNFLKALQEAETYAEYDDLHLLLLGETGKGKECFTRLIHQISSRSNKPLVAVNCGSIPSELAESQLFGHKKGSFTGASSDQQGKFKAADGGVLFLDELGELSPTVQVKLLRALDFGEIEPIGTSRPLKINVRVIAATNCDVRKMVSDGLFREDLYQRFGASVAIPSLRQRRADIPALALYLLNEWNRRHKKMRRLSSKALATLSGHIWSGNIRELRRVILQSAILCKKAVISDKDLRFEPPVANNPAAIVPEPTPGFVLTDFLDDLKKRIVERALEKTDGVQSKAARLLGCSPQAVHKFVKAPKIN